MQKTRTPLTTIAELVEAVQALADAHFQPRRDLNGEVCTATPVPTEIANAAAKIDVDFRGWRAYIYLYLADDGGLRLNINVFPGRGGYSTWLLPEDATFGKLTKHVERAISVMEQQLADAKRRDAEVNAEMEKARAGR